MALFEAIALNAEAVTRHEEDIRQRVRTLTEGERKTYFEQIKKELRDPDTYAVLNWFFLTGLHHMYLGDYIRGAVNLILMVISIILMFTPLMPLGIVIIVTVLVVELMALFRSQTVVAHYNNLLAESVLAQFE